MKPSAIKTSCWKTDIDKVENWLGNYQIILGDKAYKLLCEMSAENQLQVINSVKSFYQISTKKLNQYLNFRNKALKGCQFLSPEKQTRRKFEKWVVTIANKLPTVIKQDEIGELRIEVKAHQLQLTQKQCSTCDSCPSLMTDRDVPHYWAGVETCGKFPLLVKIAKATFVLPHGNAEVERCFSILPDIITKKRNTLGPETVKALVVSKSALKTKNWTSATIPATPNLREKVNNAYATYAAMLKEKQDREAAEKAEELAKAFANEIEAQKKTNKRKLKLDELAKANELALEQKMKEKEKIQKLLKDTQDQMAASDKQLEELRNKQQNLDVKRQRVSEKLVQETLKRHAADAIESASASAKRLRN